MNTGRDSHSRRRPGPTQYRLGIDRGRGVEAELHRLRLDPNRRRGLARPRLATIHRSLAGLVERERPNEAAVEETFVNRDPQSALKLGQARGVDAGVAGAARPAGLRICRQPDQEDGGRGRARGKAPGGDDGQDAAARLQRLDPGRRGRARGRHLPCAASRRARAGGRHDRQAEGDRRQSGRGRPHSRRRRGRLPVAASARTLRALPSVGEAAELLIEPMCARTPSGSMAF